MRRMEKTTRAVLLGLCLLIGCREAPAPVVETAKPQVTVKVLFLDEPRFVVGREPYEVAVERRVPADVDAAQAIVDSYFAGPTEAEKEKGLRVLSNGLTGARVERQGATVHVRTTGVCATNGAAYNVATLLIRNLKQVEGVRYVKLYDPQGGTQQPTGETDSIPECMEP